MEYYLEGICKLLNENEVSTKKKLLTKQEVMKKYQLTYDTCSELFQCIYSPAYKVGKSWRVDSDDFDMWYRKYIVNIKDELDRYIRRENTKRMIRPEADKICRMLYGINLDEYLKLIQED